MIGHIRPRSNAVRWDASPLECSGAFCHRLLGQPAQLLASRRATAMLDGPMWFGSWLLQSSKYDPGACSSGNASAGPSRHGRRCASSGGSGPVSSCQCASSALRSLADSFTALFRPDGFIPARAGNTARPRPVDLRDQVHPRARGVAVHVRWSQIGRVHPRTRGDEPGRNVDSRNTRLPAPHARGWTWTRTRGQLDTGIQLPVFPALAGMNPGPTARPRALLRGSRSPPSVVDDDVGEGQRAHLHGHVFGQCPDPVELGPCPRRPPSAAYEEYRQTHAQQTRVRSAHLQLAWIPVFPVVGRTVPPQLNHLWLDCLRQCYRLPDVRVDPPEGVSQPARLCRCKCLIIPPLGPRIWSGHRGSLVFRAPAPGVDPAKGCALSRR